MTHRNGSDCSLSSLQKREFGCARSLKAIPLSMAITRRSRLSVRLATQHSTSAESANVQSRPRKSSRLQQLRSRKQDVHVPAMEDHRRVSCKKSTKPQVQQPSTKSSSRSAPRKVVVRGYVPVDPECGLSHSAAVYCEGKHAFDAMLNQTNLANNNNKYYVIQILTRNSQYWVWFRWGRVGYRGQSNLIDCGNDIDSAKELFCAKFAAKTNNEWGAEFEQAPGKYTFIKTDYAARIPQRSSKPRATVKNVKPKLDSRVAQLLELICDLRLMEEAVTEMEFDSEKNPLGMLSKQQILAGYSCLSRIAACIKKRSFGGEFFAAVNEYYTIVPHCFGFRTPPPIKTKEQLKKELDLLAVLDEVEVAVKRLDVAIRRNEHPLDARLRTMAVDIRPVDPVSGDWELVAKCLQQTHGPTHVQFTIRLVNLFEIRRAEDEMSFKKDLGNRKLLWHGSRLSNWMGILSRGLRVAPPEAPTTGYMFGRGLYFADIASKSANYCLPSPGKPGFMVLAEVALGEVYEVEVADEDAEKACRMKGCHSTYGAGRLIPDPANDLKRGDMVVPVGRPIVSPQHADSHLNYNEFVVYDSCQVALRYLVQVQFDFAS